MFALFYLHLVLVFRHHDLFSSCVILFFLAGDDNDTSGQMFFDYTLLYPVCSYCSVQFSALNANKVVYFSIDGNGMMLNAER